MIHETENPMANLPKECKDCPVGILTEWRMRALRVRREIRRHQLTDNEARIAEIILDKSIGWERPEVVIPEYKIFTAITKISEPHVYRAIKGLHNKRVIRIYTVKGQRTYVIRDPEEWKVTERYTLEKMKETISLLRELNGLPPFVWEIPENFKDIPVCGTPAQKITNSVIARANTKSVSRREITPEEILPDL